MITYAPVEFPAEPPGDVPLSFFEVSLDVDGVGVSTLTNPAALELPVDPLVVPASQIARLYEWVAASRSDRDSDRDSGVSTTETIAATVHTLSAGQWSVVPAQSYDPAAGLVTAPIQRLGTYALVAMPAYQWWFPLVTLE